MSAALLDSEPQDRSAHASRQDLPEHVVVLNDVSVIRGGATGIALLSASELAKRGVRVTLLSGDNGEGESLLSPGVELVAARSQHIRKGSRLAASLRGIYNTEVRDFVAEWIRANDRPGTVYHLHGWSKILSPLVFGALKPVAGRLVVSAHDFFLACPNGGYFNFQNEKVCSFKPMGLGCVLSNCDRRSYSHKLWRLGRQAVLRALSDLDKVGGPILAVHDSMVPHLARADIEPGRLRGFRNPVTPWCAERVRAEANKRFLFVGRLEDDKGVRLAAEAARLAGVSLDVVGDGPLAAMLRKDYPEVYLHGWKGRDGVGWIAECARAVVVPTRYREAFGLVAVEALGSGLPVIIADHAMIADEITNGGMGFACDPHDVHAMANVMRRLAGDNALVAQMSARAHAGSRQLAPSIDEWVDRLLDVYSEVLLAEGAR